MTDAYIQNGVYLIDDGYIVEPIAYTVLLATGEASRSESIELDPPSDAIVERALFEVTADAGGSVTLDAVGEVREGGSGFQTVVDLGGMTTVRSVSYAPIDHIRRWNGVEFVYTDEVELQTERLLLTTVEEVDPVDVGRFGRLTLPSVPDGIELAVDGIVVWHERQGTTAGLTAPESNGKAFTVDLTDRIREARAASGGPVKVELRSLTPGRLQLDPDVSIYRVHPVAFPEAANRTVTMASEGSFTLELPLPAESDGWTIESVDLVASGSLPVERVSPATGPEFSPDARLRFQPGRPVLARIDSTLADLGGRTVGVRVAVRGRAGGGELTGRLLADLDDRPGEPLTELTPVEIEPGDTPVWYTLRAGQAVPTAAGWIELSLGYGTAEWELTGSPDPTATARIHLRRPGGALRQLTELDSVGALFGSLRLVTEPNDNHPIPALRIGVGNDQQIQFTPDASGIPGRFGNPTGVGMTDGVLTLQGTATVAGSYTFSDVNVTYRETES